MGTYMLIGVDMRQLAEGDVVVGSGGSCKSLDLVCFPG